MTNTIATFENADLAIICYVTKGRYGFHVSVQDTDSGEFVPIVQCYPNEADAIAYAKKCVAG